MKREIQLKRLLVRGIITWSERILLAFNKKDAFYFLPGGHIDPTEAASDALLRELHEETDLPPTAIGAPSLFCVYENTWRDRETDVFELILCFKAELAEQYCHSSVSSREDHLSFHFLNVTDLAHVDFRPAEMKSIVINSLLNEITELMYFPLRERTT